MPRLRRGFGLRSRASRGRIPKQGLGTTGLEAKRRFAGRIPKRRLGTTRKGQALGNDTGDDRGGQGATNWDKGEFVFGAGLWHNSLPMQNLPPASDSSSASVGLPTEDELRGRLSEEQFQVTQRKGTERAFTGEYHDCKIPGQYQCVCCAAPLFDSESKFDSGTGWPSFFQPVAAEAVRNESDYSHLMRRVEVLCARCGAHLGHVFKDGPQPTGLRYCINSASLNLVSETSEEGGGGASQR